jgi:ABC-type sugar transport system permease subunit
VRSRRAASLGELAFIAPVVILVAAIVFAPASVAVWHSFTNWNPGYPSPYVGLGNYQQLFASAEFHQVLANEAFYLLGLPLWVFLPLVMAVVLYDRVPAAGFFRTLFFFPSILAPALVGVLFVFILAPDGVLNHVLRAAGLGALAHSWLISPGLVKPTLIAVLAWASMGTGVVIYAAGLSAVPTELLDAAEIDGASWLQRVRYVLIPHLRPIIEVWAVFQLISVFLFLYAWIFVLTQGGPGFSSMTIDYSVYDYAVNSGYWGLAAAESVVIVLLVVAVMLTAWLVGRGATSRPARSVASKVGVVAGESGRVIRHWLRHVSHHRMADALSARRLGWSPWRLLFVSVVAVTYLYPFFFLLSTALRPTLDYARNPLGFPTHLTLSHMVFAWNNANLGQAVLNSVLAVSVCVLVTVVISTLGAFWLRRHPGRVGGVVLTVVMASWLVPLVIFVLPLFVTLSRLHLTNNLPVLGVIYAATTVPFGLYFLSSYYKEGLPNEVLEAAAVDGASLLRTFARIVVPLTRPALGALAALAFVWAWGDLLVAVIMLSNPSRYTATVAAALLTGRFDFSPQAQAAAAVIAMIPMLVVFLMAQRAIVRGFTAGFGK